MRSASDWRYLDTRGFGDWYASGPEYSRRIFYDRLDRRKFPQALNELSSGVFGALLAWPDQPLLVSHSYALEKLFIHLDRRLRARLAYATSVPYSRRLSLAKEIVREALTPLVDSISIDGQQYFVRFKLASGGRSPWVSVPVIFLEGSYQQEGLASPPLGSAYYIPSQPLVFHDPRPANYDNNAYQKAFFSQASTAWKN
jgi:hypothetical protein